MDIFKMIFKKIKEKQKCQSCDNKFCISNNSPCYECKGNNLWTALDESAVYCEKRSDLNLKEKTTNKNCPYCRYNNITAFAVKYNTSNRPVEEYIPVNFCPKCGANLMEYVNDRLTYFLPKRRKM